jgi:hypothetical protein
MLSLVLIQDQCGVPSPLAVKNGDKWKSSRVSKERETIITLATCDVLHLSVKAASILMAYAWELREKCTIFYTSVTNFKAKP